MISHRRQVIMSPIDHDRKCGLGRIVILQREDGSNELLDPELEQGGGVGVVNVVEEEFVEEGKLKDDVALGVGWVAVVELASEASLDPRFELSRWAEHEGMRERRENELVEACEVRLP